MMQPKEKNRIFSRILFLLSGPAKRTKKLGLIIAAVCLIILGGSTVQAHAAQIDLDQTGSITVEMLDEDGNSVGGGELALYPVADATYDSSSASYTYQYTSQFSGCSASLDNLKATDLPGILEQWQKKQNVSGTVQKIDRDGTAVFKNLSCGLYLIVQTSAAAGYEAIPSFVISIPQYKNGESIYDVNALPKMEQPVLEEVEKDPPDENTDKEKTDEKTKTEELPDNESDGKKDQDQKDKTDNPGSNTNSNTSSSQNSTVTTTSAKTNTNKNTSSSTNNSSNGSKTSGTSGANTSLNTGNPVWLISAGVMLLILGILICIKERKKS